MLVLLVGHGYVGSYLCKALEQQGFEIAVCDENPAAIGSARQSLTCRYQDLTAEDLAGFDRILWFAGHSSVPKSIADPDGAVANNCLDLLYFARQKRSATRMIYASTASVYSLPMQSGHAHQPPELNEDMTLLNPLNAYDCSKISFDALARCFAENVVGLRLGTVCGMSDPLRAELLFNAMNISAIENGAVRVANANAARGILFLDDLARYVGRMLEVKDALPPILNVGSMNVTIGELGAAVAEYHRVPLITQPDTPTYSFRMSCGRIRGLFGRPRLVSLEERCGEFRDAYTMRRVRAAS